MPLILHDSPNPYFWHIQRPRHLWNNVFKDYRHLFLPKSAPAVFPIPFPVTTTHPKSLARNQVSPQIPHFCYLLQPSSNQWLNSVWHVLSPSLIYLFWPMCTYAAFTAQVCITFFLDDYNGLLTVFLTSSMGPTDSILFSSPILNLYKPYVPSPPAGLWCCPWLSQLSAHSLVYTALFGPGSWDFQSSQPFYSETENCMDFLKCILLVAVRAFVVQSAYNLAEGKLLNMTIWLKPNFQFWCTTVMPQLLSTSSCQSLSQSFLLRVFGKS